MQLVELRSSRDAAAIADFDRWWEAYLLARRTPDVCAGTSEVLHSRRAFGDVPEVLVQEWEDVVAALARAVAECEGADTQAERMSSASPMGPDTVWIEEAA